MGKQALYRAYLKRFHDVEPREEYFIHVYSDAMFGAMMWWSGARDSERIEVDLEEFVDFIIEELT